MVINMIVREHLIEDIIKEIKQSDAVALDFETISLEDKTPVALSFAYKNKVWFCPIKMKYFLNVKYELVEKLLYAITQHPNLVFHHSAFDLQVLRNIGITLSTSPHDTLILSHLHDENGSHKLKDLVQEHFDYHMMRYKDVCGTGKKQIEFRDVSDKQVAHKYASDDAYYTLKLFNKLYPIIQSDNDLAQAYNKVERPLLLVVDDMHTQGVPVNGQKIDDTRTKCESFKDLYKSKLEHYMSDVNLNSSKQLREYFIDKKKMPILKRSHKTNEPSVDSEVLEKYAKQGCMEADWILKYRYYSKILATFVPALRPDASGLIHPHFHQVGTTSGRFSSSNPNFQNIPKGDEFDIRESIQAPKGYTFVGADYSQMELRLAAHFSQDKNMKDAFINDEDIHEKTRQRVGCTRTEAKVLNFGILYGMGTNTLAKNLGCSRMEANQFLANYRKSYPSLQLYMNQVKQDAANNGSLTLLFGRKRHLPPSFEDYDDWYKGGLLRSVANAVIQGGGAMIIKKAMVCMYDKLKDYDAHIIAQIHDEVIVMCKKNDADKIKIIVEGCMLKPTENLSIPFKVDVKEGKNWSVIH